MIDNKPLEEDMQLNLNVNEIMDNGSNSNDMLTMELLYN